MFARAAVWIAAAFLLIGLVLGGLGILGLGLEEPPPRADDLAQRIVDSFEVYEDEYLSWGRWVHVSTGVAFGLLTVGLAYLEGLGQSRIPLVAGSVVVTIREAIYLAEQQGIVIARQALDNDLPESFAAGNMFRAGIHVTGTYVGVVGLLLLASGLVVLGVREYGRRRLLHLSLGVLAIVVATPWIWNHSPYEEVAVTLFTFVFVFWVWQTARDSQSSGTQLQPNSVRWPETPHT